MKKIAPETIIVNIGDKVCQINKLLFIRTASGKNLKYLSKTIGCSIQYLSQIENGRLIAEDSYKLIEGVYESLL